MSKFHPRIAQAIVRNDNNVPYANLRGAMVRDGVDSRSTRSMVRAMIVGGYATTDKDYRVSLTERGTLALAGQYA